ncbi:MAG TPA: POTRA domain-containing protein [Acidobacteriaceae bacterium]|nr:POTRA domain-containing protein [Acidobacteriaceae bacterium]
MLYLASMKIFRRWFLLLAAAGLALPTCAQIIAKKVTFTGVPQSQAELLAYSGLAPGKPLSHADIDAAAQKLMDTGLFASIQYKYDGVELLFTMTPTDGALPVRYANFPWWDDAALSAAVEAKVPLFHGSLPTDSALQQSVTGALTTLLAQKRVQAATITATPSLDPAGKADGIVFHIDAPPIQVGAVTLSGASAAFAEPVAALSKAAAGQSFDGATESTLTAALKAIYHRQGYLEEAMSSFAHGVPQVAGDKVLVPVSATIAEGAQYKVAAITLAGSTLMSQDDFAKTAKLHPGDIANEDLLRATLAALSEPYRSHGYLRAKIDAAPRFDAAAHTVSYAVTVAPGPVFHMGELSLINLSVQQRAEVLKYWPLQEGDVYDATVATNFLLKNKANLHSLDGWSASWKAYEHEDTNIVDLVVTFQQGGTLK